MTELGGRRNGYRSPEMVLAEARRRAQLTRRDAERDAARIRREAAAWAAATRREAEEHRDRVLAELEDLATRLERGTDAIVAGAEVETGPGGDVIDLRSAARARAAAGTGRPGEVIETSIETKVHDVVRYALQRTFESVRDARPDSRSGT